METLTHETVIYKDDDFKLSYSLFNDMAFLHCRVSNFSPSSLKKGIRELGKFLDSSKEKGINKVATLTENPKFVEMLGGKFYSTIEKDGIKAEMFVWE